MIRRLLPLALTILLSASLAGQSAAPDAPYAQLSMKAALVLTPKFCDTRKRQSIAIKDVLRTGEFVCRQLESEFKKVFPDLTIATEASASGTQSAKLILIPKFVEYSATQPLLPSSKRELTILLEWTAKDASGKTIWLQTVLGSTAQRTGWVITTKHQNALVQAAADDLAKASASKISTAVELKRLAP
jgi:hypothetical protein